MNTERKTKDRERDLQPESFVTPKKPPAGSNPRAAAPYFFSEKMKTIAKQINQQSERRLSQRIHKGIEKWVLKSELKIISEPLKLAVPSTIANPKITLAELRMQIEQTHNRCAGLIQANQMQKQGIMEIGKSNLALEQRKQKHLKGIEVLDREIQSINRFTNYRIAVDSQNQKSLHQIRFYSVRNQELDQQILQTQQEIHQFYRQIAEVQSEITEEIRKNEGLSKQIAMKEDLIRLQTTKKVPNLKEMAKTLFLVGILQEQIYVLNLQKKEKGNSEQQGKPKFPRPYRKDSKKKLSKSELSQKFANRTVYIQGSTQAGILQRIFAAIFMHCRTLTLNNPFGLMNRVSFFCQEFKQVYNFNDFEEYFEILIDLFRKGGRTSSKMKSENSSGDKVRIAKMLTIRADEEYLPYVLWVAELFERGGQLCLVAGSLKVELNIISTSQNAYPTSAVLESDNNYLQFKFASSCKIMEVYT